MNLSHLNGLKAFEATLRGGSFTAASRELGVTPAAVGQQVKSLEMFVGRQLFERSPAGVSPTPLARQVAARLNSGFRELDQVLVELKDDSSAKRIAITLPSSFAENWFTAHIADFYRQRSEIDLRLDASNRMVDLLTEDFHFAIRYCAKPAKQYNFVDLFGDAVLPVCSTAFATEYGLNSKADDLKETPLIQLGRRTPDPEWPDWPEWTSRFEIALGASKSNIQLSQVSSGIHAAIAGQGLVLAGITEAFHALKAGQLIAPFGMKKLYQTGYKYRLVSVKSRNFSPLQRRFRDWVLHISARFKAETEELVSTD
ncbi:MAG: LysR substrate-binding domain-containing protein [Alphaproteobacteria bacterium]